ncbi:MAG: hypothetical protein IK089_04360 [Oxalobacter sp.]|nr:hypothetical protein [Oxalobacter sp.]
MPRKSRIIEEMNGSLHALDSLGLIKVHEMAAFDAMYNAHKGPKEGDTLDMSYADGEIRMKPANKRIKYTLDELLAEYNEPMGSHKPSPEETKWLNGAPVGKEFI